MFLNVFVVGLFGHPVDRQRTIRIEPVGRKPARCQRSMKLAFSFRFGSAILVPADRFVADCRVRHRPELGNDRFRLVLLSS